MDEKLIIGVIPRVDLVVELDVVEVDQTADGLMDSDVAMVSVVLVLEVGRLRAMSDNVVGDYLAQSLGKGDQPLLPLSLVHGSVVLPIHITSIQVVVRNELSKLSATFSRVRASTGRHFGITEGTHQNLNSSFVHGGSDVLLDLSSGLAK